MSGHPLIHRTIHEIASKIAVRLPFTKDLLAYHPNGIFPLLRDPHKDCRAVIVGMLVLRPAWEGWTGPLDSFYDTPGWCYGLSGSAFLFVHAHLRLLSIGRIAR